MAFSMHSHSGQFCPGHAKDQLEEIVQRAISLNMKALALTEHMPRDGEDDLYPEEIGKDQTRMEAIHVLFARHTDYVKEAIRLREEYKNDIKIVVGFEGEWIRPSYAQLIEEFMKDPDVDFFLGSVHHMHGIPIDYDQAMYNAARETAGGTDERLWEDYYDTQYEMLKRLRPKVVGHFDLIRLLSDEPNLEPRKYEKVWEKITRNLQEICEQGGLLEINTSALRKGLREPYPVKSICEYFAKIGGKFTLSDDSHGIAQVGLNFQKGIKHLESIGVSSIYYLERSDVPSTSSQDIQIKFKDVSIGDLDVQHYPAT